MPTCKNTQFTIDDFMEILNSISNEELDDKNIRPKKIKQFFATKACKKITIN